MSTDRETQVHMKAEVCACPCVPAAGRNTHRPEVGTLPAMGVLGAPPGNWRETELLKTQVHFKFQFEIKHSKREGAETLQAKGRRPSSGGLGLTMGGYRLTRVSHTLLELLTIIQAAGEDGTLGCRDHSQATRAGLLSCKSLGF